jgi:hypothetical protein
MGLDTSLLIQHDFPRDRERVKCAFVDDREDGSAKHRAGRQRVEETRLSDRSRRRTGGECGDVLDGIIRGVRGDDRRRGGLTITQGRLQRRVTVCGGGGARAESDVRHDGLRRAVHAGHDVRQTDVDHEIVDLRLFDLIIRAAKDEAHFTAKLDVFNIHSEPQKL